MTQLSLSFVVVVIEMLVWLVVLMKTIDRGIYKAIFTADFVVSTLDFALLLSPYNTLIARIVFYSRQTGAEIFSLPVTLGMVLLAKSMIFYIANEIGVKGR